MEALVFTADEPLYLPRYLEPVIEARAEDIAGVVIASPPNPISQVRDHYRMFGPLDFLHFGVRFARGRALAALPGGLGRRLAGRHHSVANLAEAHGVPVERVRDVSDPGLIERVCDLDPDLLLSVVCGQKLPPELLSVPDRAVNLHGSLLPRYRGRATAFWPLYYGDEETGVTAHEMTDEFDAGPIIEQRSFPIEDGDTVHDIYLKLAETGSELAVDLLSRYPEGFGTRPNPTGPEDYHSLPGPGERRAFRRRGGAFR